DGAGAGVVRGQGQAHVAVEVVELVAQVVRARVDRLGRVVHVRDAQAAGRGRHQLHEAAGARGALRVRVEAGLLLDDGLDQGGVDVVLARCGGDVRGVGGGGGRRVRVGRGGGRRRGQELGGGGGRRRWAG